MRRLVIVVTTKDINTNLTVSRVRQITKSMFYRILKSPGVGIHRSLVEDDNSMANTLQGITTSQGYTERLHILHEKQKQKCVRRHELGDLVLKVRLFRDFIFTMKIPITRKVVFLLNQAQGDIVMNFLIMRSHGILWRGRWSNHKT